MKNKSLGCIIFWKGWVQCITKSTLASERPKLSENWRMWGYVNDWTQDAWVTAFNWETTVEGRYFFAWFHFGVRTAFPRPICQGRKNPKETGGSGLLQLGRARILKNRVCPTGENCSAVGCERGLRIDPWRQAVELAVVPVKTLYTWFFIKNTSNIVWAETQCL